MTIDVLRCPSCGGPAPPDLLRGALICTFCRHTLTLGPGGVALAFAAAEQPEAPEHARRPRVVVAGRAYRLLGRLGRGEGTDVFLARRASRLTEMVVIKIARSLPDADLLEREWRVLEALHESDAQGEHHFKTLLPQPVARGVAHDERGLARPASIVRFRSGFLHTLTEVLASHPRGVDGRTAVWMWKRALETLGWIHRSGFAHGAVLPAHLLVHPRDHGVVLVGWTCACRLGAGEPLPARVRAARAYYPDALWSGAAPTVESDVVMSARCVAAALGGELSGKALPAGVPAPLADLVRACAEPGSPAGRELCGDAWALMRLVGDAGERAYGPSRYHPFTMPGWRHDDAGARR